jgi:hypothetical protein
MNKWDTVEGLVDIEVDSSIKLEGEQKALFDLFLSKVTERTPENSMKKIAFFELRSNYVLEFNFRHFATKYNFSVAAADIPTLVAAATEELEVFLRGWRSTRFGGISPLSGPIR